MDALPSAVFVVDQQFKIFDLNPSASDLFGIDSDVKLHHLCGEIMHCLNAIESKNGCGTSAYCADYIIRKPVEKAYMDNSTHRSKYKMQVHKQNELHDIHMLVTASLFNYETDNFVLLVLEDITEIIELKHLIPICANCNKIRNDENYWEEVADYLRKHADLEFTHSICPECVNKLYPKLKVKPSYT